MVEMSTWHAKVQVLVSVSVRICSQVDRVSWPKGSPGKEDEMFATNGEVGDCNKHASLLE